MAAGSSKQKADGACCLRHTDFPFGDFLDSTLYGMIHILIQAVTSGHMVNGRGTRGNESYTQSSRDLGTSRVCVEVESERHFRL